MKSINLKAGDSFVNSAGNTIDIIAINEHRDVAKVGCKKWNGTYNYMVKDILERIRDREYYYLPSLYEIF